MLLISVHLPNRTYILFVNGGVVKEGPLEAPLALVNINSDKDPLLVATQALMYPLLVACKSQSPSRRAAAMFVVDNVRQHSATLVEQAQLVRDVIIAVSIMPL